ncbi:Signal transduction histidine kinase [Candidatus Terasakiella magnetica]|nr:Signal transduction histidine kinase [Candidatus Terasakiella magnetica]
MTERRGAPSTARRLWPLLPFITALLITSLAVVGVLEVYRLQVVRREVAARSDVIAHLGAVRARLEGVLTEPLLVTRGLQADIVLHRDISDGEFTGLASSLLADYPSIRNLTLARGTVISAVYPETNNRAVLGVDYRSRPEQWPTVERAIITRKPVLAGPVPLIQGGSALIGRVPVTLAPSDGGEPIFFGLISVVIDMPAVFAAAGVDAAALPIALAIRGRDGQGAAGGMIWGDETIFDARAVEMDVTLPGGAWRLAGRPKGGWSDDDGELRVTQSLGGFLAVFVALASFGTAFYVVTLRRARSRIAESEERTHALVETLRRSNEDLLQFAYIASHDLQEPLRNVASYVQLLARRYRGQLDQDADQFIDFAVGGVRRMQEMITDLLDYSRLHEERELDEPTDSRAVLDRVLADLTTLIGESAAEIEAAPLPVVLVQANELARIFQNLIGNALKYRKPDVAPRITISASRDGRDWIFAVRDNGIGIAAEYQERIFTLFKRLHARDTYEGTGIGLAICRKLVQHNGGRIWVESVEGEGSTFCFTLPGMV